MFFFLIILKHVKLGPKPNMQYTTSLTLIHEETLKLLPLFSATTTHLLLLAAFSLLSSNHTPFSSSLFFVFHTPNTETTAASSFHSNRPSSSSFLHAPNTEKTAASSLLCSSHTPFCSSTHQILLPSLRRLLLFYVYDFLRSVGFSLPGWVIDFLQNLPGEPCSLQVDVLSSQLTQPDQLYDRLPVGPASSSRFL